MTPKLAVLLIWILTVGLASPLRGAEAPWDVPADHPAIVFSDYVLKKATADGYVRFDRILEMTGRGYRWDSPGTRMQFRTDSLRVAVRLRYSEKHISPSARAPVGLYLVDGRTEAGWTFGSRTREVLRPVEEVTVTLPVPAAGGFHDYALVLPYGDSVDFAGLTLDAGSKFAEPKPRPALRYVAFGDSITHGFTASHVGLTYPYLLAEARGWQLVNMGYGGRTAHATDGEIIRERGAGIVTVLLGANEWQGGMAPETYRANMRGLLAGLRERQPRVPVYVITPLWVSPNWKPARAAFDLERYREELRALVKELADPALHLVEGPALIDHDERFFDRILVHPNDAGFAQMAARLSAQIAP